MQVSLPAPNPGQELIEFQWTILDPLDGMLNGAMALTRLDQALLIIRPGTLPPGSPVRFMVQVRLHTSSFAPLLALGPEGRHFRT